MVKVYSEMRPFRFLAVSCPLPDHQCRHGLASSVDRWASCVQSLDNSLTRTVELRTAYLKSIAQMKWSTHTRLHYMSCFPDGRKHAGLAELRVFLCEGDV